jgi:predicted  nucleic acid-binding Zn-ribbon protein
VREAKAAAERDVSRLREQLEAREEEFDAVKAEVLALKKDREEVRARVEKMLAHMDALIEEEQA